MIIASVKCYAINANDYKCQYKIITTYEWDRYWLHFEKDHIKYLALKYFINWFYLLEILKVFWLKN